MTEITEPLSGQAEKFLIFDSVSIKNIPEHLLAGLPEEDQNAIRQCVFKSLIISGFDSHGNAEIEFLDAHGNPHTIWIGKEHLTKIKDRRPG